MERDLSHSSFPLWLELSGLPRKLNAEGKHPFAWTVFHRIVEEDLRQNVARPGIAELSVNQLAEACGLDTKKTRKAIGLLRKAGVMRVFLPENDEEQGCFQVITPIPTPRSSDEVRALHGSEFLEAQWPPRYAVDVAPESEGDRESRARKIERVSDLYLNTFSMRLNSLIVDELQLISDRYDLDLIEKVFQLAKRKDVRSLGWVASEIRREMAVRNKAVELRTQAAGNGE
ncbi:hypothetical protein IT570_12575 [Candidatus Sumerlaeota bacterium]|nr:hypothetical protein [Candidatus Sumerlaeota bacterium]